MADDMKIEDATRDENVTGVELLPISDNGAAKCTSIADVKNFVLAQLAASTSVQTTTLADDKVYIHQGNATKQMTGSSFADAFIAYAFDKTAKASDFTGNEIISIEDSNAAKTVSLTNLVSYVRTQIGDLAMNIHGLDSSNFIDNEYEIPYAHNAQGTWGSFKIKFITFMAYVVDAIRSTIGSSTSQIDNNDELLFFEKTNHSMRYAKFSDLKIGKGDTLSPSTNSNEYVPQWDGNNSKTLKNGLQVIQSGITSQISAGSTNSQVPTAAAVYQFVDETITDGDVVKSSENTTWGNIPQWDETSNTLKDGLSVTQTISSTGGSTSVPTVAAVRSAINAISLVTPPSSHLNGYVPTWDGSNTNKLSGGVSIVSEVTQGSTDSQIPTAKSVKDAIASANYTIKPASNTNGKIPTWNGNNSGTLSDGLSVSTSISSLSTDSEIPTAKAVIDKIGSSTSGLGDVVAPNIITSGNIPSWSGVGKALSDGYSVVTEFGPSSTNNQIPTAKLITDQRYIKSSVNGWFSNRLIVSSSDYGCSPSVEITSSAAQPGTDGGTILNLASIRLSCLMFHMYVDETALLADRSQPLGTVALTQSNPSRLYFYSNGDSGYRWHYITGTAMPIST